MFTTLKRRVTNEGLSNKAVTTYGLTVLGIVVVHETVVQERLVEKDFPLHTFAGKKFFFCFGNRTY